MKHVVLVLLLLAAPDVSAAPSVVTVNTPTDIHASFETVNGNVVRCFAEGEYALTQFAGSAAQPPKIVINGRWGHRYSVIDFAPHEHGSTLSVKLVYAMGRGKRSEAWTRALNDWLGATPTAYCPAMP